MNHSDFKQYPHRRFNLLTGEWILVSPHRSERPWTGQTEPTDLKPAPSYDPDCYLCPTNTRACGIKNPGYTQTYVFDNDFSALIPGNQDKPIPQQDSLLLAEPEQGICRVICYSPQHNLNMARMDTVAVTAVIDTWIDEYRRLGADPRINHVQIFENRGRIMGCSNEHPHGQIWANHTVPTIPQKEAEQQKTFYARHDSCLLCSYLERELNEQQRLLFVNDSYAVIVPFWATWPFETLIIPRTHAASISSLTSIQKRDLAEIMIRLGICYDNLFATSFPYSMGIHQQPTDGRDYREWHWHLHYYPPLLRSRSVKKHMVGYELLAMPQRDITPEKAAQLLSSLPETHYREVEE